MSTTGIDNNVYNGTRKVTVQNKNFMTTPNIRNAILSLKLKNSEGYDRIPQRTLLDGISILLEPFETLFNLSTQQTPYQNNGQCPKSYKYTFLLLFSTAEITKGKLYMPLFND